MQNNVYSGKNLWWKVVPAVVYLACTVSFFYPYFNNFDSALVGPPEDNMQDFWNTWYSQKVLDTNPIKFFSTNLLLFPEGASLIYHSFSYPNLILIFIIRKIFNLSLSNNILIALHNGMLLLSFYIAAIGAYFLIKKFTQDRLSALIGGFIFGFSPFHFAQALHHMHTATIQFIPFFVLCFFEFVESKRWLPFIGTVFFFVLNALSCWYYLFYSAYFIVFYYVYNAIKKRQPIIKELIKPIVTIFVSVFILLSPLTIPMIVGSIHNERVYTGGHNVYVADLLGFIIFHPYHLLSNVTSSINSHFAGNPWEATVYLGVVNIALFLWACLRRQAGKIENLSFCLWGMFIFILFACGSSLHIYGESTNIWLPTYATKFLPFIKNVRTPSRAIVYTYLFMGIAIALIISKKILNPDKKWQISVFVMLSLLIFIDFYPTHRESTNVTCPVAYKVIKQDTDKAFGIIDLPVGYTERNRYMMYQAACHQQPIVNASVSRQLKRTLSDKLDLIDLQFQRYSVIKNQRKKELLTDSKVKYIVIHTQLNKGSIFKINIDEYRENYQTIYSDPENVILRVY